MRWLVPLLLLAPSSAFAAYTQSAVTKVRSTVDGKPCVTVSYTETEAAAASTASIALDWTFVTIRSIHQDKTAGSAVTLRTVAGRTAGWVVDDMNHVLSSTSTADPLLEQGKAHAYLPTSTLYVRAGVSAGSDNSVSSEFLICSGWF